MGCGCNSGTRLGKSGFEVSYQVTSGIHLVPLWSMTSPTAALFSVQPSGLRMFGATEAGEEKAKENGVMFWETSAKMGTNIKALFRQLAQALPGQEEQTGPDDKSKVVIGGTPQPTNQDASESGCKC